mgnify:CR=1 FL=1
MRHVGGRDHGVGFDGEGGHNYIDVEVECVTGRTTTTTGLSPEAGGRLQPADAWRYEFKTRAKLVEHFDGSGETLQHKIPTHLIIYNGR